MEPVSIVIITSNEEHNIRDCLDSVFKLDYPSFEVIIVDSSNDKSRQIINEYKRVKLIRSKEKGFSKQRNLGIKHAKHEFIAFTDADCILPKNWLKLLMSGMEQKVAAIGGNAFSPKDSPYIGKCIACLGFPAGGDIGFDANVRVCDGSYVGFIATCNALFRKIALMQAKGFDDKLIWGGEDTDLCRRITKEDWLIKYNPDSFVYHKTRNSLVSFIKWCYRRGKAKYHINKQKLFRFIAIGAFALPFIFVYFAIICPFYAFISILGLYFIFLAILLFTHKFHLLIKRRKRINISLASIVSVITALSLLRQIAMMAGYIAEWTKSRKRPQK